MGDLPNDLKYTKEHEWVREEGDGTVTIGISDHAQEQLGDLVFVELPEVGDSVEQGRECGVVESVKAASDIYAPVTGEVVGINEVLADSPETANQDPFGDGWLLRIKLADAGQLDGLMTADAYAELIAAEAH